MNALRWPVTGSALLLTACAGMLNWDEPPERMRVDRVARVEPEPRLAPAPAPTQRSMQLLAESHVVEKGDTLYSIAFRNNLDRRELAQWNGIGDDGRIVSGQVLRLTPPPGGAEPKVVIQQSAPPAVQSGAAPAPAATAAPPRTAAAVAYPSGYQWQWPTLGKVLRGYAPAQGFKGVDFTGNLGQPVFAAAPGRVVYSGNALKGYGELIIIKHDETYLSAYGYNRRRHVAEGDVVTGGQPIGELGMGPENKPLLHFEIRERGKPINPLRHLPARP